MTFPKTRVILVDDHTTFVEAMTLLLEFMEGIELVKTSESAEDALPMIEELMMEGRIDVVLMDLRMPGIRAEHQIPEGIRCARQILAWNHELSRKVKVIILSGHDEGKAVSMARRVGIQGYLLKNCGKTKIKQAIDMVQQGGTYYQTEAARNEELFLENYPKYWQNEIVLTDKEQEILALLATGKRNSDLRWILSDSDKKLASATIERYLKKLREKFHATTNAELIMKAVIYGFLQTGTAANLKKYPI